MTVVLAIALLIIILMPCALYVDTISELIDKVTALISKHRSTKAATKQERDIKKEYQEKINNLNKENQLLQKENKVLYEEIDKLSQKLEENEQEKAELAKAISNKNQIVEKIKEESLKQHEEKDECMAELLTQIHLLEEANKKLKEKFERKATEEKSKAKEYKKDFRKKYPADIRCQDGEYVRSKSERDIDDFFFQNKIWHIYEPTYIEPKTKKKHYPDFYLPDYNLYIEYFGMTTPEYLEKRDRKITMYLSDKSINFEYLTQADDNNIYEKLKDICLKYSIPTK